MPDEEKKPIKRRSNSQRMDERLLEAAVALWAETGLAGVTITSVAQRAKCTRRTVYQHFATRELIIEAAESHLDEQLAKLAHGHADAFLDPYGLVAGLAVDSHDLVRTHLLTLLNRDAWNNPMIQDAIKRFHFLKKQGLLKEGVDPEHGALITMSIWFAALLAVSLGRTEEERRDQAHRFSRSFNDIMAHGAFVEGFRVGSYAPAPAATPTSPTKTPRKRTPPT